MTGRCRMCPLVSVSVTVEMTDMPAWLQNTHRHTQTHTNVCAEVKIRWYKIIRACLCSREQLMLGLFMGLTSFHSGA